MTAAFWGAGLAARSPRGGEAPFQPTALYYVLRTASVPSCCTPTEGVVSLPVTTTVAIEGFGERKLAAARCHRSQRHLQPLTPEGAAAILTVPEVFHRAVPSWKTGAPEGHFHGMPFPPAEPKLRDPSARVAAVTEARAEA